MVKRQCIVNCHLSYRSCLSAVAEDDVIHCDHQCQCVVVCSSLICGETSNSDLLATRGTKDPIRRSDPRNVGFDWVVLLDWYKGLCKSCCWSQMDPKDLWCISSKSTNFKNRPLWHTEKYFKAPCLWPWVYRLPAVQVCRGGSYRPLTVTDLDNIDLWPSELKTDPQLTCWNGQHSCQFLGPILKLFDHELSRGLDGQTDGVTGTRHNASSQKEDRIPRSVNIFIHSQLLLFWNKCGI